ncbi:hypothetical protein, partial [Methylomagnum sp.]
KKPPRQNNHGIYMGRGQAKRIQNKEHDNAKNLSYSDKSNSAFDAVLNRGTGLGLQTIQRRPGSYEHPNPTRKPRLRRAGQATG